MVQATALSKTIIKWKSGQIWSPSSPPPQICFLSSICHFTSCVALVKLPLIYKTGHIADLIGG